MLRRSYSVGGATEMKKCTKCGKFKIELDFYTYHNGRLFSWCKKCHLKKTKQYQLKHKKRRNELQQIRRKKLTKFQKIKLQKHRNKYNYKNYHENKQIQLICILRRRLNHALKGVAKSAHTLELLGCSISQLIVHLEKRFKNGMTWKNYGKWHVDHIKPLSSFDLTKSEQQILACNYKNLQPLWAKENLLKSNKPTN